LIGAYRDNEVTAAHPLMRKIDAIRTGGGKVAEIKLPTLVREDLGQLIADALRCELEAAAPLARLSSTGSATTSRKRLRERIVLISMRRSMK
jgi:predicted ATPase